MTNKRKLSGISGPEANLAPVRITNQAFRKDLITREFAMRSTREVTPEPSEDKMDERSPSSFQRILLVSPRMLFSISGDPLSRRAAAKEGGGGAAAAENGADDSLIYLELDNQMDEPPSGWGMTSRNKLSALDYSCKALFGPEKQETTSYIDIQL
ncbi:hypothetical protein MLD38_005829 [Melastoma candidum]|uniref:Uncharacterized protein n=1 Tax=Melastoma candidum TaxID=119954 RepID=A0ACB9RQ38_9MYRT|nr:hypothetical protein MLD38_005829 [Melastoma candidum]